MKFGIEQSDINRIRAIFAACPRLVRAIVFGSRAMGNYKQGSDVDIAVEGSGLTFNDILELKSALEELGMLYEFDILDISAIKDPEVLAHIQRVGKVIFHRP